MPSVLAIGDFARATHLSIKKLRNYHRLGLLEPADIDTQTGYRRYTTEQIPTGEIIRRFRDVDMPLDEIGAVLAAPDFQTRNELIAAHLRRLEAGLARTQSAVVSLRNLLAAPVPSWPIEHRRVEDCLAAVISEVVDLEDALSWYQGALGELHATLAAQHIATTGPAGGVFSGDLFAHEHGQATVFVPCAGVVRPLGRVSSSVIPGAELATIVHSGPHSGLDRAYGALATYVAEHALAVDGPIREYYLVGPQDTADEAMWRTEVGWPIFATGQPGLAC